MSSQKTVLATWLVSVLQQFEAQGIAPDQLGDGVWMQDACKLSPTRPLELVAVRRLWHQAMHVSQTPLLGAHVGLALPLQAMHIMTWIVMHSPDLRHALRNAIRHQGLVSNSGRFDLENTPRGLRVVYAVHPSPVAMHTAQVDSVFAGLLGLLRRCCAYQLNPAQMHLPGAHTALQPAYESLLRCPVGLARQSPSMEFFHADLDRPFFGADPSLLDLAQRRAIDMLHAQSRTQLLVDHVRATIIMLGVSNAESGSVASAMSMSVRTLQRRLEACDTSFRRLLEATRMEEAVRLLADPAQSMGNIADLLGYSDLSALSHAVRAYWGASPRSLREEILGRSVGLLPR